MFHYNAEDLFICYDTNCQIFPRVFPDAKTLCHHSQCKYKPIILQDLMSQIQAPDQTLNKAYVLIEKSLNELQPRLKSLQMKFEQLSKQFLDAFQKLKIETEQQIRDLRNLQNNILQKNFAEINDSSPLIQQFLHASQDFEAIPLKLQGQVAQLDLLELQLNQFFNEQVKSPRQYNDFKFFLSLIQKQIEQFSCIMNQNTTKEQNKELIKGNLQDNVLFIMNVEQEKVQEIIQSRNLCFFKIQMVQYVIKEKIQFPDDYIEISLCDLNQILLFVQQTIYMNIMSSIEIETSDITQYLVNTLSKDIEETNELLLYFEVDQNKEEFYGCHKVPLERIRDFYQRDKLCSKYIKKLFCKIDECGEKVQYRTLIFEKSDL